MLLQYLNTVCVIIIDIKSKILPHLQRKQHDEQEKEIEIVP